MMMMIIIIIVIIIKIAGMERELIRANVIWKP